MAAMTGLLALVLSVASNRLKGDPGEAVDEVEALLPRIQCGQCGFPGCRPYAEAMLSGAAAPNLCPPGGQHTVAALTEKLGSIGTVLSATPYPTEPVVAAIDEDVCIGCALCLPACPFDAIVGAHRFAHTVLESACTGCSLCIPPCPVDCISMVAIDDSQLAAAARAPR